MLSERRNHGRIRINPCGRLGSLNVLFPVEELPKFTPTFDGGGNAFVFNNQKYSDITYGLERGGYWENMNKTCNAGFNSIGSDVPHNNLAPYKVVYLFTRTA